MSAGLWFAVAGVGGAGAVGRFLLINAVSGRWGSTFPLGTFVVNLSGTFVLGLLVGLALPAHALLIAGTATIGSYTTFSTWMLESERLAERGAVRASAVNLAASLVLGVGAAALGKWIGGL